MQYYNHDHGILGLFDVWPNFSFTASYEFSSYETRWNNSYIRIALRFSKRLKTSDIKPLSTNPTKWWNTLKQFVGNLPSNCLSVFDHFVKLTLKGLKRYCVQHKSWMSGELFEDWVHELDRKFPYLRQR